MQIAINGQKKYGSVIDLEELTEFSRCASLGFSECTVKCCKAGKTALHSHFRDREGGVCHKSFGSLYPFAVDVLDIGHIIVLFEYA